MPKDLSRRYDHAVIITRNNSWLVPRTCDIIHGLHDVGIKVELIAYTGCTPGFTEPKKMPQLGPARRWIDHYFENIFVPWVEQRAEDHFRTQGLEGHFSYMSQTRYATLNQMAEFHTQKKAVKIEKMGDEGRKQYHEAILSLLNPPTRIDLSRTLGVSTDTRLLIGKDTLKLVPHHGFHAGRMRIRPGSGQKKAVSEATTIKMVDGGETRLEVTAHRLGDHDAGVDSGGVIGQYSFAVDLGKETMYGIRERAYRGMVSAYLNSLGKIIDPNQPLKVIPQGDGPVYDEMTEAKLAAFLPGSSPTDKLPHSRLIRPEEFLDSLSPFLPPGTSITKIPEPHLLGVTVQQLEEFERKSKTPAEKDRKYFRDMTSLSSRYDDEDGMGLS